MQIKIVMKATENQSSDKFTNWVFNWSKKPLFVSTDVKCLKLCDNV